MRLVGHRRLAGQSAGTLLALLGLLASSPHTRASCGDYVTVESKAFHSVMAATEHTASPVVQPTLPWVYFRLTSNGLPLALGHDK